MWNNKNVACVNVLSLYLPGVTMKHLSQSLGSVSSLGLPRYQIEMIKMTPADTSGTGVLVIV
jgi:hypothetical protein